MTPDDLARLKALAERATPGPWRQHLVDDTTVIDQSRAEVCHTTPEGYGENDGIDFSTDVEACEANAAFIAACDPTTILALIEAATPVPVPAGEFAIPAVVEHAPVYFENIDPRLTGRDAPEILRSAAMVVRQQMEFLRGTRRKAWDGSYVEALLKAVERVADSLEGKA